MAGASIAHDFAVDDVGAYVQDLYTIGIVKVVF